MAMKLKINTRAIIIIGDSNAGKSSLISRKFEGRFSDETVNTVGLDFVTSIYKTQLPGFRSQDFNMQIWDTAGMERFRTINRTFYKKADAVILCFDTTCKASFVALKSWMKDIEANGQ